MKKFVVVVSLFVFSFQLLAQATKKNATLFFKDGRELNCFARVSGENIRYADIKMTDKEIIVNFKELKGINIWMNDKLINLLYKTEQGKSEPKLMEVIIKDKMKLYRISDVYEKNIGFANNKDYLKKKKASTVYFLQSKNDDNEAIRVGRDFKEIMKAYFSDCKLLSEKIGKDQFRKKDILKIVLYYNENCITN